jgi:hypothetical protein
MTTLVELGEEMRFLGPIRTESILQMFFYFRRAQRDSAEKTSEFGLSEHKVMELS